MIARIWIAVTVAIAIVLTAMVVLCALQFQQVYSQLVRQRLGVTVEAAAGPFRSMVELGMPASMVRNGSELLARARTNDPAIAEIRLFNPSGIVVASTREGAAEPMPAEVRRIQADSESERWSVEFGNQLISGSSIRNESGTDVAGIAAYYPISELTSVAQRVATDIGLLAVGLFAAFSAMAALVLKVRLRRETAALTQLDRVGARLRTDVVSADAVEHRRFGLFEDEFQRLASGLDAAASRYETALTLLPEEPGHAATPVPSRRVLVATPETRLGRRFARGLTPFVAILILGAVLLLGASAYVRIEQSLTPELARRSELIGSIAQATITRTIEAGVPIDGLVGAEEYFEHLLSDFPEVTYFAIATDRPLVEVGRHEGGEAFTLPIRGPEGEYGFIVVETSSQYVANQFRGVVLDLAVIIIVAVLFAFELIVLVMGGSITGPLDRVLYLVNFQAAGDFTKRLSRHGRGIIDQVGAILSTRATELNRRFGTRSEAGITPTELQGFRLIGRPPDAIRFCSVGDVRLALFLFAASDQLPLSFFSLFARDVENPFPMLDRGLAISLPLAAYLLAALFGASAARPLASRFGHRGQYLAAAAVTIVANIGFYVSYNLVGVIGFSALNGVGFALASLACQDYVIDRLPKEERSRSISLVSGALFAGVFAGTALGGIIADRIGQRPVFMIAAVLVLASALLILWLMPRGETAVAGEVTQAHETFSINLVAPLGSLGFAALALGIVVPQIIADQVFVSYLLSLALDDLSASIADIARLMMIYFLVLIGAGYLAAKLPPRFAAPAPMALVSSLVSGVSLLAPLLWPSPPGFVVAAVGAGFGHGLSRGPLADLVLRFAEGPLAHLGTSAVLGSARVLERGASVAGLLAISALTGTLGYGGATGVMGALLLAGAALFALSLMVPYRRAMLKQGNG